VNGGTVWRVEGIVKVSDGDTLRVLRSRALELDGRHYRLADDPAAEPDGVALRLVWVDTPERGDHPGWETARADLRRWLAAATAAGPITAVCYASGGWDRLMADLIDAGGRSCSQWLMTDRGWPPYVGPA
jgi:endonuclease YncB( thermonuclease family)